MMRVRSGLAWVAAAAVALSGSLSAEEAARKPLAYVGEEPVRAQHGMVVSVHNLASDAGVEVLKAGGNAVDAAVATGFALAVVHSEAGNLGGGGFMLLRMKDGRVKFLDFRERAPKAASEKMYLDAKGEVVPDASWLGYRSIATPGSVAGLTEAEAKYGRLGLKRVMAPAIRLAERGYVLTAEEAEDMADPDLSKFADSKKIFQRNGRFYKGGERFRQPLLARTMRRIAANPREFYHGKMAAELAEDLAKGGALITREDLENYRVEEREAIVAHYHGMTVYSAPPPSSGGIVLAETLNILERESLAGVKDRSAEWVEKIGEAYRRAYMDRQEYLGDPDFNEIPTKMLTSKEYAAAWQQSMAGGKVTASSELKRPKGFLPPAPKTAGKYRDRTETTHYSVVDAEGNAVAVTTTLDDSFGSRVTSGKLGFLLNDEMDDFAVKANVANLYGLIQGPANLIAPLKRPLSSMTPTIVTEGGKLRYVLGSPGGSRIPTTVVNILLSTHEGGLNIQEAVDAPRFHHQYQPDELDLEPGFSAETVAKLQQIGYKVHESKGFWSNGECIEVDPKTGVLLGGQDHRGSYGKAAGY